MGKISYEQLNDYIHQNAENHYELFRDAIANQEYRSDVDYSTKDGKNGAEVERYVINLMLSAQDNVVCDNSCRSIYVSAFLHGINFALETFKPNGVR